MAGSLGTPLFCGTACIGDCRANGALSSWPREPRDAAAGLAGEINALAYWYYYVPDYLLAVLMYTLLGRAILGLVVEPGSTNYIWRFFCRITDPVVAAVALVTPKASQPVIIWLFGVVWLFWLRVGFLYAFLVLTAAPPPA